jgi:hypothetical protein
MVEVKVLLLGNPLLLHSCSHSVAILTDLTTRECYKVDFGLHDEDETIQKFKSARKAEKSLDPACCTGVVTLYSNKNLNAIVSAFKEKKEFEYQNFQPCFNNCSDAVSFTLDYFFDKAKAEKNIDLLFKILFCIGFIGTLGLLAFCPSPPGINSPNDIFRRAELLRLRYGSKEKVAIVQPEQEPSPSLTA